MTKQIIAELVVIGSGPAGYTAAFRAADLGKKVVLIEKFNTLGGVCLNVGCIPSKALLHVAKVLDEARDMSAHGVKFGTPEIDRDQLLVWKKSVINKLTGGLSALAKQRGVQVLSGQALFTDSHQLSVQSNNETTEITFEQAIIAVGSSSSTLPFIPEDPRIFSSTGALELANIQGSLLVLGGGIIGLEMATVYAALGVDVTVVEFMDQLIPAADADIVSVLQKRLIRQGIKVRLKTKVTAIDAKKDGLYVSMTGEGVASTGSECFSQILVAVGRQPNGGKIQAEKAGVSVDARGFIPVDKQMRTNVQHIFAIGDVVGQPMLAHKGLHEGKVAAEVACGLKHYFDPKCIANVAYTDPEVAFVGLTEKDAKSSGIACEKATFPWAASGRALSIGRSEGLTKLLFCPTSKRLLGAGIVGVNAGELIAELALAIEMNADVEDIALTIHPHPTVSETVGQAAEMFEGTITDLYFPKKKQD